MKKFFTLVLMFLISEVYAGEDNTIFLDLNGESRYMYNYSNKKLNPEKLNISDNKENEDYIYHPVKYVIDEGRELYSKKTISDKKEKKFGNTTFGVKADTTLSPDSVSQKRTLYSNQKITDKMTFGASYETNASGDFSSQTKGTVGIGPEYQMNKKIKLKNKYSKNLGDNSNKGEVSVEYKPFKDDRFDFNAGAAQVQRDNGNGSSSQVNFGTNFRF